MEQPVCPLPSLAPPHLPLALLLRWRCDGEGALHCPACQGRGRSRRTPGFTLQLEKPLPHVPVERGDRLGGSRRERRGRRGPVCLQNDESRRFIFRHRWFPSPFSESYLQTGDPENEAERGPMTLKEGYAKFSKPFSGRVPDTACSVRAHSPRVSRWPGQETLQGEPCTRRRSFGGWL